MTYEIKQTETGHFAVMELWPVEIARFGSPTHARLFVERVLCKEPGAPCGDVGGIEPVEARFDPRAVMKSFSPDVMEKVEAQMDALVGPPMTEPDPVRPGSFRPITSERLPEQDWERALARVAAGETCTAVAEDMGLPFGSLRARWAARSKAATKAAGPEVVENGHDTHSDPVPAPARVRQKPVVAGKLPRQVLSLPDETEDVSGRPDRIARREIAWNDEIDLALIEAGDDEERLWKVAQATGTSIERRKRRQKSLIEGIAREIGR